MLKMYVDYVRALVGSNKGQGMVEYGLVLALVAAIVVGIFAAFGDSISGWFGTVTGKIISNDGTPIT